MLFNYTLNYFKDMKGSVNKPTNNITLSIKLCFRNIYEYGINNNTIIIIHIYIAHYSHCALMRFFKKNSYTLTKYT